MSSSSINIQPMLYIYSLFVFQFIIYSFLDSHSDLSVTDLNVMKLCYEH